MKAIFLIILFLTLNSVSADLTNKFSNEEQLYAKANPKMIWSEPTNFLTSDLSGRLFQAELKAGINVSNGVVILSGDPLKVLHPMEIGFANNTTNYICSTLPKLNQWLLLSMVDTNGASVSKTAEGLAIGKSPNLVTNVPWRHWGKYGYAASLFAHSVNMYDFNPTKYFVVEKSGLYKLTVIEHLYVLGTNTCLKTIALPPVTVEVRVEK